MGRWNRKRKKSNNNTGTSRSWTFQERKDLLAFLLEYREGAIRVYHPSSIKYIVGSSTKGENAGGRTIGGIEFPALTDDVVRQPYLCLPRSLTSKQRKMAHETCVEGML
jgi:DNA modification methylase